MQGRRGRSHPRPLVHAIAVQATSARRSGPDVAIAREMLKVVRRSIERHGGRTPTRARPSTNENIHPFV